MKNELKLVLCTGSFFIFMIIGVLSVHLYIKPDTLSWELYDPRFLRALNGNLDDFAKSSCNPDITMLFGTSALEKALVKSQSSRRKWELFSIPLGNYNLSLLKFAGPINISFLLPVLNRFPACQKTILLHSDLFLTNMKPKPIQPRVYFNSIRLLLRAQIEQLWPDVLQSQFLSKKLRLAKNNLAKQKLKNNVYEKAKNRTNKRFNNFNGIKDEHLRILHNLIDRGAQIIILEVKRSKSLETQVQDKLQIFRQSIQELAEQNPEIEYFSFNSLDDSYYFDFRHLNAKGTELFHQWFNNQYSMYLNERK